MTFLTSIGLSQVWRSSRAREERSLSGFSQPDFRGHEQKLRPAAVHRSLLAVRHGTLMKRQLGEQQPVCAQGGLAGSTAVKLVSFTPRLTGDRFSAPTGRCTSAPAPQAEQADSAFLVQPRWDVLSLSSDQSRVSCCCGHNTSVPFHGVLSV